MPKSCSFKTSSPLNTHVAPSKLSVSRKISAALLTIWHLDADLSAPVTPFRTVKCIRSSCNLSRTFLPYNKGEKGERSEKAMIVMNADYLHKILMCTNLSPNLFSNIIQTNGEKEMNCTVKILMNSSGRFDSVDKNPNIHCLIAPSTLLPIILFLQYNVPRQYFNKFCNLFVFAYFNALISLIFSA